MNSIVQTLPYSVFKESDKINKLFEAGMSVLHIRKPLYTTKQMKSLIEGIHAEHHCKIVIHSHYSLLRKFSLKGIHVSCFSLNNLFIKQYFKYLKAKNKISISITVNSLNSRNIHNALADYVFIGPAFKIYSEENIVSKMNLFEAKKELSKLDLKIYVQGVYNLQNISAINAAGFSGSVLQSFIWKSDDILNNFKALSLTLENRSVEKLELIAI